MGSRMQLINRYRNSCMQCGSQHQPAYQLYEDDFITLELCHKCLESFWSTVVGGDGLAVQQKIKDELSDTQARLNDANTQIERLVQQRDHLILTNAELVQDGYYQDEDE